MKTTPIIFFATNATPNFAPKRGADFSICCWKRGVAGNPLATFELLWQHFEVGDKLRHVLLVSVSESYATSSQVNATLSLFT